MKRIRFLFTIAILSVSTFVYGQNEKFKALFIYNFTNYVDWPSNNAGAFVITIVGESPIVGELEAISKIKKINGVSIDVRKVASPAEAGVTQILYIPASKKRMVPEAASIFAGKPTLIITDNASGEFGINFVEVDSKQSFQVSKSNIEAHRLKVSSSLLTLGIAVN